jgi:hypothetical protein
MVRKLEAGGVKIDRPFTPSPLGRIARLSMPLEDWWARRCAP